MAGASLANGSARAAAWCWRLIAAPFSQPSPPAMRSKIGSKSSALVWRKLVWGCFVCVTVRLSAAVAKTRHGESFRRAEPRHPLPLPLPATCSPRTLALNACHRNTQHATAAHPPTTPRHPATTPPHHHAPSATKWATPSRIASSAWCCRVWLRRASTSLESRRRTTASSSRRSTQPSSNSQSARAGLSLQRKPALLQ